MRKIPLCRCLRISVTLACVFALTLTINTENIEYLKNAYNRFFTKDTELRVFIREDGFPPKLSSEDTTNFSDLKSIQSQSVLSSSAAKGLKSSPEQEKSRGNPKAEELSSGSNQKANNLVSESFSAPGQPKKPQAVLKDQEPAADAGAVSRVDDSIVIKKQAKGGKKPFYISGLPDKKIKEVVKRVSVDGPSAEEKKSLAKKAKKVYEQRRKKLLQSCGGKRGHTWDTKMQLIAVPDRDFSVCVVQKAGSSSWHRLIYRLREPGKQWTGDGHLENRHHGQDLPDDVKHRLIWSKNGTRVLTVRHPFARLISGWNNKFHRNYLNHNTRIFYQLPGIEEYVGRHKIDKDHVIAFEDFVQYIIEVGLDKIDHHFHSIEEHCSPCDFPYDYIVKAETSQLYSWWVLEHVNATMGTYVKHTATGSGSDDLQKPIDSWQAEREVISAFFRKVPLESVKKLLEIYADDFRRFEYSFDIHTMMPEAVVT